MLRLQEALNTLGPVEREILSLRHFEERTRTEMTVETQAAAAAMTALGTRFFPGQKRRRVKKNTIACRQLAPVSGYICMEAPMTAHFSQAAMAGHRACPHRRGRRRQVPSASGSLKRLKRLELIQQA
jgi:hypothetical protein